MIDVAASHPGNGSSCIVCSGRTLPMTVPSLPRSVWHISLYVLLIIRADCTFSRHNPRIPSRLMSRGLAGNSSALLPARSPLRWRPSRPRQSSERSRRCPAPAPSSLFPRSFCCCFWLGHRHADQRLLRHADTPFFRRNAIAFVAAAGSCT